MLASAIGLYLTIGDEEPDALVVCAAANEDQADLVFDAAKTMCASSPTLSAITERYDREIIVPSGPGGARLRRVAAVAGANDGMNIHGVICDELHEWIGPKGRSTWDVLTNGIVARKQPLVFQITTAGWDEDTVCFQQYQYGKQVQSGKPKDPSYFFFCCEPKRDANHRSIKTWRAANPSFGVTVGEEAYRDLLKKKSENVFRRITAISGRSRRRPGSAQEWDSCKGAVQTDPDVPSYIGVDFGRTRDTASVVLVALIDDELHVMQCRIWTPRPGQPVKVLEVEDTSRSSSRTTTSASSSSTGISFLEAAERLENRYGVPAVVFEQNDTRMAEASTMLFNLVREGRVTHNGNQELRAHVPAARAVETPSGFRIQNARSGRSRSMPR